MRTHSALRFALVIPLACGAALACGSFGSDSASAGDGASDDAAAGDAPINPSDAPLGPGGPCPSSRGPKMVLVTLQSGARFCIDSTEVTVAHYTAFLDSAPQVASQPPICSWNTDFKVPETVLVDARLPIVKVDWCDAYAYCAWAGKRLCGSIADGGALRADEAADASASEWTTACSRAGSRPYPYGQTEDPTKCNNNGAGPVAVGSYPACQGGYDGLFDMTGNVAEWENACDDAGARCADRGGSYSAPNRCGYPSIDDVKTSSSDWGIRCCASAN